MGLFDARFSGLRNVGSFKTHFEIHVCPELLHVPIKASPVFASRAEIWPEAAARACRNIGLFAATPETQDPRRQWVFANNALDDLTRLCAPGKGKP